MNISRLIKAYFPVHVRINDNGATSMDGPAAKRIADSMMDRNLRKYGNQYVQRKMDSIPEDFQLIQITIWFSDSGSWNEVVILKSGVDYHGCIVDYTWAKRSYAAGTRFVDYFTNERSHVTKGRKPFVYQLNDYQKNQWVHDPFKAYWGYKDGVSQGRAIKLE